MKQAGENKDPKRIAAFMSGLVFPGAGQFYNGQRLKGAIFTGIEIAMIVAVAGMLMARVFAYMESSPLFAVKNVPEWISAFETLARGWIVIVIVYVGNRIFSVLDAYRHGGGAHTKPVHR